MDGDLLGSARRKVDAAGKVMPGDRLLIDRAGDRYRGGFQLLDLAGNIAQRADAGAGGRLHCADLFRDHFSRAAGLHREFLDLAGDHRKSASGLASARGLDRGVEREQIGALGNRLDQFDDLADFLRRG